jgi:ABC-type glycerol-3-phosphate transport system substrate-binding protein
MKMSRLAVLTSLVAVSALLLTACSSTSTPTPTSTAPVTITFTGSDDPATYVPVIKSFEAKYPYITVKYSQVPQASFDSTVLQRLKAKDTSIDVFTVDQPTIAQFAASGVLSDMSAYSAAAKKAFPADQYNVNFYKGKMWALPVWSSTGVLYYNKDAFTKAGVPFPSADPSKGLSWEQLKTEAAEVQSKAGLKSGFTFEDNAQYASIVAMAASAGGGSGLKGSTKLTADVDNAGWKKAMTYYGSLFSSGIAPRGTGSLDTDSYFSTGSSAFFISGPWDIGGFAPKSWAAASINWGVAPYPHFAGGKVATPTGAWSWSYNPVSKHKDADLKFIQFASLSGAGNYDTVKATTIIPSNLQAAAKYFPSLQASALPHTAGLANILTYQNDKTPFARAGGVGYVQFETIMDQAVSDIVNGANADTRLAQAQSQIQSALASLK